MGSTRGLSGVGIVLGRIMLALLFLVSALGMAGNFQPVAADMAGRGIPWPEIALALTILLWLCGGACLLLGWKSRPAATVLFLAMIPITLAFHAPWTATPEEFQNQMNHFLMNLAIMGGLLLVAGFGAGPLSLDQRRNMQAGRG